MTIIKYMHLLKAVVEETGLHPTAVYDAIIKIRQLPDELKAVVYEILNGNIPNVEYHSVALQDIIEKDKIAPLRAVLMLDWIRREPAIAMRYMEIERYHAPQKVTEADKQMLNTVLEKLHAKGKDEGKEIDESDLVF